MAKMTLPTWITAPFSQDTPVSPAPEADVIIKLGPVVSIPGDDMSEIFLDRLATMGLEGKTLVAAYERMATTHPLVSVSVVHAASLGGVIHFERALHSLRAYNNTRVAVAPLLGV